MEQLADEIQSNILSVIVSHKTVLNDKKETSL